MNDAIRKQRLSIHSKIANILVGDIKSFIEKSVPAPIAICDTQGFFIYINQWWEQSLGYTLEDLIGLSFTDLIHPDDLAHVELKQGEEHIVNGESMAIKFKSRFKDKSGNYLSVIWFTRSHELYEYCYYLAIVQDRPLIEPLGY